MTLTQEREVVYVEKDAKPPLVISNNPADHHMFDRKDENWRYLPFKKFESIVKVPPSAGAPSVTVKNASVQQGLTTSAVAGLRVRDVVTATAISAEHHNYLISITKTPNSGEVAEIVIDSNGDSNIAMQIDVADHIEAEIVLRDKGKSHTALNLSINLAKAAKVRFVLITEDDAQGVHYGQISVNVGRDASITAGIVSLGGDLVRRSFDSSFEDVSGEMVLLGATFSNSGQYCEHRTVVDHNKPHCRSYVDFRSAVSGKGTHSVWIGDTIIRFDAIGSDTYETNRNLVLSKGARADSVPNLEIETGEVAGAGHASATGRLDDEQIFYLTSRGLSSQQALKLIVIGFFANIVERMGVTSIVEEVVATIESKLIRDELA